jgi:hypothetical protein
MTRKHIRLIGDVVLHPRYKLSYFREAQWPQQWIDAAEKIVREQWEEHYKPSGTVEVTCESVCQCPSST